MKIPRTVILLCAVASLSVGCAPLPVTELPLVGPQRVKPGGYLIVKSRTQEHNSGNTMYYSHTGYKVYAPDGQFLRSVQNHITDLDETPSEVPLPPGKYFIRAESEADGPVRVPVLIAAGRTTVVDLDQPSGH